MKKILFGILALFLLAVIGTASATVTWKTIPSNLLVMNEDVTPSFSVDLAPYVNTASQVGTITYSMDTTGVDTHVIVTRVGSVVTFVTSSTSSNWYGNGGTIKFIIDDNDLIPATTSSLVITVNNVDDAAVWGTLSDQTVQEDSIDGVIVYTNLKSLCTDIDSTVVITATPTDTNYQLYMSGNDLKINGLKANYYTNDAKTVNLNCNEISATFGLRVVSDGNKDAPVILQTIPDQKWTKGELKTLDLKNYLSDADDIGTLPYTYKPITLNDITVSISTEGIVTFTPKVSTWKGTNTINFTLSDGTNSVTSNEVKLVVREKPDFVCEDKEVGDLTITSIEDPGNTDKFKPGEEIPIKVKVHNDDADEMDVVVKAFLYYESGDDIIENAESDSVTIDSDDTETIEFNLVVPSDQDVDEGNYVLYLKAYEDGDEDKNCDEENVDIKVNRDSHDIIISKLEILPLNPKVGDDLEITVSVENIGTSREDDVTVKITNTELGLNLVSDPFDLKKYDSDENDKLLRFTFKLPSNIAVGGYDLNAVAYNDDGDAFDASDDAEKLVSITLTAGAGTTPATTTTTTTGTTTATTTTGATTTTSKWTDVFGSFEGSKLFWIIGDIILVIVAIFFIKLIFSGRRKPVKEARL